MADSTIVPRSGRCYIIDATDSEGQVVRGLARYLGRDPARPRDLWQAVEELLSVSGVADVKVISEITYDSVEDLEGAPW